MYPQRASDFSALANPKHPGGGCATALDVQMCLLHPECTYGTFRRSDVRRSLGGSQWQEILRAFYGILQAAEELLQVGAAFYEVDFGGVDYEEVGGGVAEEEMFVGAGDFLDVLEGNLRFFAGGFFGDARAQNFRLGLEVDDQVGRGKLRGERFVVALVELQLFVIEIEIGEDAVFLHQEIGDDRAGRFDGQRFAKALLAVHQEVHLRAQGGAGLFLVEVGEKRIVLAVVDAPRVQPLREDLG